MSLIKSSEFLRSTIKAFSLFANEIRNCGDIFLPPFVEDEYINKKIIIKSGRDK